MGDTALSGRSQAAGRWRVPAAAVVAVILGAAACGGATVAPDAPSETVIATPVVEIAPPQPAKVAEAAPAAGEDEEAEVSTGWHNFPPGRRFPADKLGIAECDAYFASIAACLGGLNEKTGGGIAVQELLEQIRVAFREAASTPEGREQLTATCKTAQATATLAALCR